MTASWQNRIVSHMDVDPASLLSNPKNYRRHPKAQQDALAGVIAQVGYVDPILVQAGTDVIVDGHLRVELALRDGQSTIPVDYLDLTDEETNLVLATIDPLSAMADHDADALSVLLADIQVDDPAVQKLLDDLMASTGVDTSVDGLTDPDEIPDAPAEPITRPGDLWLLGRHRLLCGDSTVATDVARLMAGERAEMVFTDPPYGVDYQGGHFHSGDVHIVRKRERLANDRLNIYALVLPVITQYTDGPCYVWFAGGNGEPVYRAVTEADCEIHALIIWHKINATYAAMNAQYKQRHECLLYFKPKGSTLRWIGPTDECTVWEMKRDPVNDLHPTQKPVELAERAINNHRADLILDLFGGSGSTLIASERTGRRCAMMELDPVYCDVIVRRFEDFTGQTAVLASDTESQAAG